jgi:DNA invertase Pin-like site-specific DNA recombinase
MKSSEAPAPQTTLHIYTRVSTVAQADDGMSLETQRDTGIARAERHGFLHQLWNEGGRSSNHEEIDKRPVLSQVLAGIRSGLIKHLYVYDQSRLSRNDYVSSIFRFECQKHGVTLYNKDGKYDLANPQDQFMRQILDAVAQFDNSQRAERTRLGKLSRVRQGCWMGGPPPFGYAIEDRRLVLHPVESDWVKKIFEAYADRTSSMDIKVMLDSNGVKPRRGGSSWSLGSLQALLGNSHYVGHWDYKDKRSGEEVRVSCPRILSTQLWQEVQKTKQFHVEKRATTNPVKHFYMLRGLLKCGHCGTWMGGIFSAAQGKHHYFCPKKERVWSKKQLLDDEKWQRGRVCSMTRSLNMPETDQLVWDAVVDVISKSSLLKEKVRTDVLGEDMKRLRLSEEDADGIKRKVRQLKKELSSMDAGMARLESERILEALSPEQYPMIRNNISKKRIAVEAEIESLEGKLLGISQNKRWLDWVGKFRQQVLSYKDFTPEKRREFLQGMLTSIDVHLDDPQTHRLILNFQVPLVGDELVYFDPTNRSVGYTIFDGATALEKAAPARRYSKKKTTEPTV